MPGDAIVRQPWLNATRAITVAAPPARIWPWLLQLGYGRAGWYSYDWIDNDAIPSADRIIPELQTLEVGDVLPTGPEGGFKVVKIQTGQCLVLHIDEPQAEISATILLAPLDDGRARFIFRIRARFAKKYLPYFLIFDPGDFVMMRKMMLGIKRRAESGVSVA